MKKITAMVVAIAIGFVFVSTVSAQLKLERFRRPKLEIVAPHEVPTFTTPADAAAIREGQSVCFPHPEGGPSELIHFSAKSIEKVDIFHHPPAEPTLQIRREKCIYSIKFGSFAEAATFQAVLMIGGERNIVVWLSVKKPVRCSPPTVAQPHYSTCDSVIGALSDAIVSSAE